MICQWRQFLSVFILYSNGGGWMRNMTFLVFALLLPLCAHAQLVISAPWTRATVPQQKATGVFMKLEAAIPLTLVGIRSPAAGIAELHMMKHEDGVMKMRPLSRLPLKAGEVVELKPGSCHIMLMDLKAQLVAGERLPLVLVVENDKAEQRVYEVKAEILPVNAQGKP
jgi:copper(I)-binding protein